MTRPQELIDPGKSYLWFLYRMIHASIESGNQNMNKQQALTGTMKPRTAGQVNQCQYGIRKDYYTI